jgi:hypothetical protein
MRWPARLVLLSAAACASKAGVSSPVDAPRAAPSGAPVAGLGAPVATTASTRATLRLDSAWGRCHATFAVASDDRAAELARLTQGCGDASKLRRVAGPFSGEQSASDRPQTYRWKALAGHCYRAYGVGVRAVKNLDILLQDSNGVVLGQDGADDGAPVVLDAGAVCFKADDDAALVVSVGDGKGAFTVELWGD